MKQREMSLYIHIPFCVKKCNYCDFLSFSSSDTVKKQYIKALCQEIESFFAVQKQEKDNTEEIIIKTIFFGGGTPSILEAKQIEVVMDAVRKTFVIAADAEITIEMNPGTIKREKLETYQKIGINRLSIGLQTTDDERLKVLGRVHTYEQFLENYKMARELGFQNISVDLMSALPKESINDYQKDLERVLELEPEHISSYSLIIEEGTPFYDNNEILERLPSEEEDRAMYDLTEQILLERGYHRYEISNYAKTGKESRHNSVYWTGGEYVGFGLGASSYLRSDHPYLQDSKEQLEQYYGVRFKNETNIKKYIQNSYVPILEKEEVTFLSKQEAMEEFMFLGLRMMQGIKEQQFLEQFHISVQSVYGDVVEKFVGMGLLEQTDGRICFTKKGIDVSNSILCEFLKE
ncbi:MAG: oxygen-independent coproporphyrinogen III oxidase [Firmicutes bacterium]|uniref:Heme chaperone HemW n=1 Tax=Candidatus Scybalomonas excrementavium TaxID=2840943 RepID=A0A9D9I0H4_9FIRM|nr:oxygen-independent coproporphyrinogen III oxidase [Candidatus Scybalomonas excrementavium]